MLMDADHQDIEHITGIRLSASLAFNTVGDEVVATPGHRDGTLLIRRWGTLRTCRSNIATFGYGKVEKLGPANWSSAKR